MSLDELPPLVAHRRLTMAECEAEERAERYREMLVRDECESVEAEESMWRGRWAAAPKEPVYWDDRPGYDRRAFAVDGDVDRPSDPAPLPWVEV